MMDRKELMQLAAECRSELTEHILPFWMKLKDPAGGFYGRMTHDLSVQTSAPKGVILHARILWTFSSAYLAEKNPAYLETARHAYEFLCKAEDAEKGGVYWSLDAECNPFETNKYTYCMAFAVYGLSLYAEASGSKAALDFALRLFSVIEEHAAQPNGYAESFYADWSPLENDHLSEHDLGAAKTMNTTLHLIEAYAELFRITGNDAVGKALAKLLHLMAERIYDPEENMLRVFFDENLNVLGDLHSYGHDIEASWLTDHACDCLGDGELTGLLREIDYKLALHIEQLALDDGFLYNERFETEIDKTRVWWVQAEGVIGFLNAAEYAARHSDAVVCERMLQNAASLWAAIRSAQIDPREGGEWFGELEPDGTPRPANDMAGPWKCPYHNGRMCLEVMRRTGILCELLAM